MASVRLSWLPRWPYVVGAGVLLLVQEAGTRGASLRQTEHRPLDALAVVIAVLGPLVLLGIRRWTRGVMWFVAAITLVYLLRDYAYGPVLASLALAAIGTIALGRRRTAWAAMAAVVAIYLPIAATMLRHRWAWGWVLGVAAWTLLILAIGELIRARRDRVAAALETEREASRRAANEQKLQIARELHDSVAHHISLISVQAGVALHVGDRNPEQATTALAAIKDASKEALGELRALVGVLRADDETAPRSPGGSLATLDDLVERTSYAGLRVRKSVTGTPCTLPPAVELAGVRIVQEAITNVLRHADAKQATIELDYRADVLTVTVSDDGRGMPVDVRPGSGLRGMRERAEMLGGGLRVDAGNGGTVVRARLPLGGEA